MDTNDVVTPIPIAHRRTVLIQQSFQCRGCFNDWLILEEQSRGARIHYGRRDWWCPWCGLQQRFPEMEVQVGLKSS